ncbi:MAG: hypothetical protein HYV51_01345 [Parcubacteria group bacterium]|nr:hypothetical protein [Parcubacteria group bacterium]
MDKKLLYLFLIIIAAGLIAAGYFYFKNYKTAEAPVVPSGGTVENLIDKVTPPSPTEKLPDTNPVNKTNPFKNLKTNPFE